MLQVFLQTIILFGLASWAVASTTTFDQRDSFEAQLGVSFVDDYSAPGYSAGDIQDAPRRDIHSNVHMSSVLGETDYLATGEGNDDFNFVLFDDSYDFGSNAHYCSGCNGSFRLSFQTTSVGSTNGVFGVGFDLPSANNLEPDDKRETYTGFVRFGDGTTAGFQMPRADSFFGLTSDLLIKSIHLGEPEGAPTNRCCLSIDNLTIGSPRRPELEGDFDGSGALDLRDVNMLSADLAGGGGSLVFDVSGDGKVDSTDLMRWVTELRKTWFGDANLNGEFNSGDLVAVFEAGKYETDNFATWSEGDWNADGRFGTGDLVVAFEDGGYLARAVPTIPEPTSAAMLLAGLIGIGTRRRYVRSREPFMTTSR